MMSKINFSDVKEAIGVVSNAPINDRAKGFGFVELEDGTVVYCNADLVRRAKMRHDDVGTPARVRYAQVRDGQFVATRLVVLRGGTDGDQALADLVTEIDDHLSEIDDKMQVIFNMLSERGCKVPEFVE